MRVLAISSIDRICCRTDRCWDHRRRRWRQQLQPKQQYVPECTGWLLPKFCLASDQTSSHHSACFGSDLADCHDHHCGAGKLGYAKFNSNLIDEKNAEFSDPFWQFNRLGAGFCMNFLTGLYIVLRTLLFSIFGIIKTYSYAVTPYILAEHWKMTAREAITESGRIKGGNKSRLFCPGFSFIGWSLLCSLPMLIAVFTTDRK